MLAPHGLTFGTVVGGTSGNAYVQHPLADRVGGAILHPEFSLPGEHHERVVARFGVWPPKRSPELGRIRRAADVFLDYLVPEVDPDVALLWFPEPDTSQHAAGVGAGPAIQALAAADGESARILGELDRRGATPDVLVVSDHGYSTIARRIQLEEVVREAGFPAGDRPGGVTVAANGGAGLFYVRDSEPRALERFTRWLVAQPWAARWRRGARGRRAGAPAGHRRGAGRAAGSRCRPVVSLGLGAGGRRRRIGGQQRGRAGLGTHGSGSPQELRCTLVGSGPSFGQGLVSELPSGNVDVAPTVLRLLGVTTDAPLDGRPLTEGLRETTEPAPSAAAPACHEANCDLGDVRVVFRAVVERVGVARYVASLSAERA